MSDKMDFTELTTSEEEKEIEAITNLIENRTELTPTEKKKDKKDIIKKATNIILDSFVEGD